jgi:cyclopropane-fatty-acyl-phospholipid synthase
MNTMQWGMSLFRKFNIFPVSNSVESEPGNTLMQSTSRHLLLHALSHMKHGRLCLFEKWNTKIFGKLEGEDAINASITVVDEAAYNMILSRGSLGAAEAYMAGYWTTPDLTEVIRLFVRNRDALDSLDVEHSFMHRLTIKALHGLNRNTPEGSRRNIHAHYDLGNELFSMFLDPQMMYSSAMFQHPAQSLDEAAVYKLDRVCQKLELSETDHLLEIGTGWGGLAIHAARQYGCRVTTTTISAEQHQFATDRVAREGLSDKITVLLCDYRELKGEYDKLVSIEMIEAVGAEFQQVFFETCDRLLKPNGFALIQAITIREDLYKSYLDSVDFIRQYIFPGGCLPTLERMSGLANTYTSLKLTDNEDITTDYAMTLRHWRERFLFARNWIMGMGFDLEFIRMFEYYFCYCEGGFMEKSIGTHQLLYRKS